MLSKKKLKEKYGESEILVIPFERLTDIKDKFTKLKHRNSLWSSFDNDVISVKRYDAEGNPSLQQIIPYILVTNENRTKFFITQRINGEVRLKNKYALGVGGHIDNEDGRKEVLFKAAYRELMEEINAEYIKPLEIIGTVRDMKSSTNDHFGVVIIATVSELSDVSVKEVDILKGEWITKKDLIEKYELFESWSQIIINKIIEE